MAIVLLTNGLLNTSSFKNTVLWTLKALWKKNNSFKCTAWPFQIFLLHMNLLNEQSQLHLSLLYSCPNFHSLVMKNSCHPWLFALSSSPKSSQQHLSGLSPAQAQPTPHQTHTFSCFQAIKFTNHSYLPPYCTSLVKNANTLLLPLTTSKFTILK